MPTAQIEPIQAKQNPSRPAAARDAIRSCCAGDNATAPASRSAPPSPAQYLGRSADRDRTKRPAAEWRSSRHRCRKSHQGFPGQRRTPGTSKLDHSIFPITSVHSSYAVGSGGETHSNAQWLCQLRISSRTTMNPNQLTEQLGLFLDVLETGSFSAASRRHPLTPSAVARRIDSLETPSAASYSFAAPTRSAQRRPAWRLPNGRGGSSPNCAWPGPKPCP
jgi:hypothetical protein